jgi:hypothetical protein
MNVISRGDFAISNSEGKTVMSFSIPTSNILYMTLCKNQKALYSDRLKNSLIRCEGYIPRPLSAELRVCTLSQIPYENNHTPTALRRGWLIDFQKISFPQINIKGEPHAV